MSALHTFVPLVATAPVLVGITRIDHRTKRIPDRLSLLGFATAVATMTVLSLVDGTTGDLARAATGAVLLTGILGTLHLIRPDGLGMGDVKLALTLGLLLGWTRATTLEVALMIAWCLMLASALGLATVAYRMRTDGVPARGTAVQFGPALCAGTAAVTVFGPTFLTV